MSQISDALYPNSNLRASFGFQPRYYSYLKFSCEFNIYLFNSNWHQPPLYYSGCVFGLHILHHSGMEFCRGVKN